MSAKLSIFIPVYRESELLKPLLENILADPHRDREIFVIVDEPTTESLRLAKDFSGEVRFVLNGKRKGKANVLNEVVEQSTGEVLLFLDSDLLIDGGSGSFLRAILEQIGEAEIVEVRKDVVRDSFLSRIVSYDYLGFNFTNWFFSWKLKKCLGLNGAAFAIKRETFITLRGFRRVIVEDLDIGTRAFINGVNYRFLNSISVYTKAPSSWGAWFKQRKRWGIGSALWFKEYSRELLKIVRDHPGILLLSLLFIFPCLPFFLVTLFMPEELYVKVIYVSLLLLSTQASFFMPPTALTSTSLALLRNLVLMIGSLGAYSSFFYLLAKKMGSAFNPFEFAVFYLIYSPLWLLMMIVSLTKVYLNPEQLNVDWET